MSSPPRVPAGLVGVEVPCPACGVLEFIAVRLSGVLTTPDDDTPSLRVKCKGKPLDHECGRVEPNLFTEEADRHV